MSKKDKIPDIDEMIKDCKAKQKPNMLCGRSRAHTSETRNGKADGSCT